MGVNRVAPIVTGQSNAQTIKGSLRFNSGSSQYLTRTPSTVGNRRTWTISCWIKFSKFSTENDGDYRATFIGANNFNLEFWPKATLRISGSQTNDSFNSLAKYRDTSAWYHLVVACDTTLSSGDDRFKIYMNGVRQANNPSGSAYQGYTAITQNYQTEINNTQAQYIGVFYNLSGFVDLYLSNFYLIDGQALGPDFFGFTDPLTGTWRPRKFEKGLATVNDGTTWTSNVTTNGGTSWFGGAAANVFDGDTGTYVQGALGGDVTFVPTTPIRVKRKLRIWADSGSGFGVGNGPYQISYNGTQIYNGKMWNSPYEITIAPGTSLSSLVIDTSAGGEAMRLFAIEVDGIIMKNATTQILEFGTNGFYLPMDDQNDYTTDKSGKGNNWTANGFTGTSSNPDVVPDSPSGIVGSTKPTSGITTTSSITKPSNYATLNPLVYRANDSGQTGSAPTFSNGNLTVSGGQTNDRIAANMSFKIGNSGKYYWEILWVGTPASSNGAGVRDYSAGTATQVLKFWYYDGSTGDGGPASTFTLGDTLGFALDTSSGNIDCYKNGVKVGSMNASSLTEVTPFISMNSGVLVNANFGQKPFKFQPPDGYLTLCSANVRPSTVVTRPDQYVGVTTYTGNGTSQSINVGWKPDFVWIKERNGINEHNIIDTVRGQYRLRSNDTGGDVDVSSIFSFSNNGFNLLNSNGGYNGSTLNYVAWTWKAGGNSNTYNIDGRGYASAAAAGLDTGTLTPSGASVNTKSGFSIVTWVGAGSGTTRTISHGLGRTPSLIIAKNRTSVDGFPVYHSSLGNSQIVYLNTTAGQSTNTAVWNSTSPTSTVFNIGSTGLVNELNYNYVAYLWADVPGLQKFGSYTGNGSAEGPFVELGFRPAIVLFKNASTGGTNYDWVLYDNKRAKYNPDDKFLCPNLSYAENVRGDSNTDNARYVDFLSNGFKVRNDSSPLNLSSNTIIYAAFAEAPSFNLYGAQSNAR